MALRDSTGVFRPLEFAARLCPPPLSRYGARRRICKRKASAADDRVNDPPPYRGDAEQPQGQSRHAERVGRVSGRHRRSEEHTSELQSLMRISYAVFCLKKKRKHKKKTHNT